ncbi:hypothetical protein U8V72_14605 [Priestia filamentosa]
MFKFRLDLTPVEIGKVIVVLFFAFVIGSSTYMYFSTHNSNHSYVSVE